MLAHGSSLSGCDVLTEPRALARGTYGRIAAEASPTRYFIWRYNHLVKVKTSITLPKDLLQAIDHADSNRSSFLEKAARQFLAATAKARRETQDAAILNARSESLNREALDVLEYQDLG